MPHIFSINDDTDIVFARFAIEFVTSNENYIYCHYIQLHTSYYDSRE